ncbi:MAG: hypothetical protein MRJ96_05100 [Nitrospirales bacterium]|nr:hypothetical protein [Nitrospirales bacterium]
MVCKKGLLVLLWTLGSLIGCTKVEVNTVLDQTAMAPEGYKYPEEFICNVKLKLTCYAGVICFREVTTERFAGEDRVHPNSIAYFGEENLSVTSCSTNTTAKEDVIKRINIGKKTYRLRTIERGKSFMKGETE